MSDADDNFDTVVIDVKSGTSTKRKVTDAPSPSIRHVKQRTPKRCATMQKEKKSTMEPPRSDWQGCFHSNFSTIATKMSTLPLKHLYLILDFHMYLTYFVDANCL